MTLVEGKRRGEQKKDHDGRRREPPGCRTLSCCSLPEPFERVGVIDVDWLVHAVERLSEGRNKYYIGS